MNIEVLLRAISFFGDPERRESYFDLYDDACVLHYPNVRPGIAGIREFYKAFWEAFPDVHLQVHETVEQGDLVALRFSFSATHRGPFLGVPATGRPVAVEGITILQFRGGKCIERWSQLDMFGLMQQLGAAGG